MHYVTEDELRQAYLIEPFQTYRLAPEARLTPGARQFLIDRRVDFEQAPVREGVAGRAAGAGRMAAAADRSAERASLAQDFAADVAVMGAKLRLLGCHALGVDNALACACDETGSAWLAGENAPAVEGEENAPAAPCLPAMGGAVHPVYFEMAVLDAELARTQRFWEQADVCEAGRARVAAWASAAARVRSRFAAALARVQQEVPRG